MPRRIPTHYKRFLAGSPLNPPSEPPKQEPAIPLVQLTPTENEVDVVSDAFGLVREKQPVVKARRKKLERKIPTPREQFNLTRREISGLLDAEDVESALQPFEVRQYRKLATGNLSESELAKEIGMRDEIGIGVYIAEIETRIIRRALLLRVRLEQKAKVETDTYDRTRDEDRAADERGIAKSGGDAIGGSVISAGNGKKLDSFEHGGKIRTAPGGAPDEDFTGGEVSEQDDYGEESGA
ncbi:MAG TPA: hypothetical protein VGR55_00565 [Candidatus Acidoferrum sp.]|nr:hypothetical protein [Candidatus Acidoferrum sp.]